MRRIYTESNVGATDLCIQFYYVNERTKNVVYLLLKVSTYIHK